MGDIKVSTITAAGATPEGGWPWAEPPWLRPSPRPSHAPWAREGLGGQPGQGQRIRGTLWPPPPKPTGDVKVSPVRPSSLPTIRADGTLGAIRLGEIAPRTGDLLASPAQANGGH